MKFKRGADVFTAEDEKVGTLNRVVIDPQTGQVTHIVVEKGWLFVEDKVVPVDWLDRATEEGIFLRADVEGLEELPDFVELHYISAEAIPEEVPREPPEEAPEPKDKPAPRSFYWYPPVGVTWWHAQGYMGYPGTFGYPRPGYVPDVEENIPEGTVALKEGAHVVSREGKRVGDVEQILVDPQEGRATHLVISRGLLLQEEKLVPTSWIEDVTESEVFLIVGADLIDRLPKQTS